MMGETFNYNLPKELIAQYPLMEREKARMMVLHRGEKKIEEDVFSNIENYFNGGDVLILNDTRVIPARLKGKKETGGRVEIFLLKKTEPYRWEVLLRGNVRVGQTCRIEKDGDSEGVKMIQRTESGSYIAEFHTDSVERIFRFGETPLPPYIKRSPTDRDKDFYQTVYANKEGAVAAPTAGLHFTESILKRIEDKGVKIVCVTLHIGWASFKMLRGNRNTVGEEYMEVPEETANIINSAKESGGRVFACGTSVVRTLESAVDKGKVVPKSGYTKLFIKKGFVFHIVDHLITNFHLPGSTHLYLLCAFTGIDIAENAYKIAVDKKYRFYSYGDSMLII
jgi:S-adenosylmethionine:tRNA ribosyltransferase-isomerase